MENEEYYCVYRNGECSFLGLKKRVRLKDTFLCLFFLGAGEGGGVGRMNCVPIISVWKADVGSECFGIHESCGTVACKATPPPRPRPGNGNISIGSELFLPGNKSDAYEAQILHTPTPHHH